MIRLMCGIVGLWRSILAGAYVSGHNYVTSKERTPPNVHVLECEVCGHVTMCWSWSSLEESK